jgi:hypothetical protein
LVLLAIMAILTYAVRISINNATLMMTKHYWRHTPLTGFGIHSDIKSV